VPTSLAAAGGGAPLSVGVWLSSVTARSQAAHRSGVSLTGWPLGQWARSSSLIHSAHSPPQVAEISRVQRPNHRTLVRCIRRMSLSGHAHRCTAKQCQTVADENSRHLKAYIRSCPPVSGFPVSHEHRPRINCCCKDSEICVRGFGINWDVGSDPGSGPYGQVFGLPGGVGPCLRRSPSWP